ncbi:hypothetical protein [Halorientalis litorea]|jgi:uncharacterized membrane protein|uniref:hypothetical protein n=1 Tax=Halorientalis litorea TaxID=2931977 RepID=UPI001FF1FD66|nr:hypothetical protein [Halorientalis litorea]
MVLTALFAVGALGGIFALVYLAAVVYLFVLLLDIRHNTKETAERLDRIATALENDEQ